MNEPLTRVCPACGNHVRLAEWPPGHDGIPDAEQLDRMAHAVCGCFVLDMSPSKLGRLLAAMLDSCDAGTSSRGNEVT